MEIPQLLATVGIPSLVALAAVWKVSAEVRVKRHVEITDRFMQLIAVAHSRPTDGRDFAGLSEQIAAIELVAAFGRRDRLFGHAAGKCLRSIESWSGGGEHRDIVKRAAGDARQRLRRRHRHD